MPRMALNDYNDIKLRLYADNGIILGANSWAVVVPYVNMLQSKKTNCLTSDLFLRVPNIHRMALNYYNGHK